MNKKYLEKYRLARANDNLRAERQKKRLDSYQKGRKKLLSSESNVFDKSLSSNEKMKVISPEIRQAKVDAYRKARRKMQGRPLVDAVGDTLNYNKIRKEASKLAQKKRGSIESAIRKGIKPLSKGLKLLPIVGALAGMMATGEASAAIPVLDSAESVGMSSGEENQMMAEIQGRKDYKNSQASEDREKKLAVLAKLSELRK